MQSISDCIRNTVYQYRNELGYYNKMLNLSLTPEEKNYYEDLINSRTEALIFQLQWLNDDIDCLNPTQEKTNGTGGDGRPTKPSQGGNLEPPPQSNTQLKQGNHESTKVLQNPSIDIYRNKVDGVQGIGGQNSGSQSNGSVGVGGQVLTGKEYVFNSEREEKYIHRYTPVREQDYQVFSYELNNMTEQSESEKLIINQQQHFSEEELSHFDGTNGQKAYVAIDGIVYDVSNEPAWSNGAHHGLLAGSDLTNFFCHGPLKDQLKFLPIVGVLIK